MTGAKTLVSRTALTLFGVKSQPEPRVSCLRWGLNFTGVTSMTPSPVNNSKHWRERAAQMRALSDNMSDSHTVAAMLRVADDYDMLADRADVRSNGGEAIRRDSAGQSLSNGAPR
jgi:hypothetical protein